MSVAQTPSRVHRSGDADPIRVVRIIARLNVGGPAIQAVELTKQLDSRGYRTTLVRGREELDEGSMDHLADARGVRPVLVPRCDATRAATTCARWWR